MNSIPLVSIIIPVYNGSNYLREAIDSAIAQTYPNIEIIVVNDGSEDDGMTEAIALSYGDKIRYFNKSNGGVSTALNLGIQEMRGEYFSWLSHDDKYLPEKIELQVDLLQRYGNEKTVALCAHRQIDSYSKCISKAVIASDLPIKKRIEWKQALCHMLDKSCNGCALLIPKRAFEDCGSFHEELRYSQDALMWYLLFIHGYSLLYDTTCSVENRIHNFQVTQLRRELFYHDSLIVYKLIEDSIAELSDKEYNYLYKTAKTNAVHRNYEVARLCAQKGFTEKKISHIQVLQIKLWIAYGKVRPWIRKIYYKVSKNVNTR